MKMSKKSYPGLNIQWPISELIFSGEKTIETRTYPIPNKYLNQEMLIIETPGKQNHFKARIRAVVVFTECFQYSNRSAFYRDQYSHKVTPGSEWDWKDKPKWGWRIGSVDLLVKPIPFSKKKGIVFTKKISIRLPS